MMMMMMLKVLQYGPAVDSKLGLDSYRQTDSKLSSYFLESVVFSVTDSRLY